MNRKKNVMRYLAPLFLRDVLFPSPAENWRCTIKTEVPQRAMYSSINENTPSPTRHAPSSRISSPNAAPQQPNYATGIGSNGFGSLGLTGDGSIQIERPMGDTLDEPVSRTIVRGCFCKELDVGVNISMFVFVSSA